MREFIKVLVKTKKGNHYYINDVESISISEHFILLRTCNSVVFNRSVSKDVLLSLVCSVPGGKY